MCTHFYFVVTSSSTTSVSSHAWEESTGFLASVIPQTNGASPLNDPLSFNASKGEVKLGPAPVLEELRAETERTLREQAMIERDPNAQFDHYNRVASVAGVTSPSMSELLPHPPSFKTVDVKREVEKVRDARKRIPLDPAALAAVNVSGSQSVITRIGAPPSICAYTLHDAAEGYVALRICVQDSCTYTFFSVLQVVHSHKIPP